MSLDRYLEPVITKLGTFLAFMTSGTLVIADWFLEILNNNAGAFGVIFAGITTWITWYYKRKDDQRKDMYAAGCLKDDEETEE